MGVRREEGGYYHRGFLGDRAMQCLYHVYLEVLQEFEKWWCDRFIAQTFSIGFWTLYGSNS